MSGPSPELLTVDCGNSTIGCRRSSGAQWTADTSMPELERLAEFARGCSRAAIVSVVPAALDAVRRTLVQAGLRVDVAGHELRCPLRLAYDTVDTLGADRWLGAYAANRKHGAAVVVDCGTATTVNVVDAEACFHGGAIAPGLSAMASSLRQHAPALPLADVDASPLMPARATQACVDSGVVLGWVGMVEKLVACAIDGLQAIAGDVSPVVVVTGGHAERLLRMTALRCEHAPLLLHDGLGALTERVP